MVFFSGGGNAKGVWILSEREREPLMFRVTGAGFQLRRSLTDGDLMAVGVLFPE